MERATPVRDHRNIALHAAPTIHVAGINMLWRASERSIRDSVRNAMGLAAEHGFKSIAFPVIGAGSGGFNQERARAIMEDELAKKEDDVEVGVVVYKKG